MKSGLAAPSEPQNGRHSRRIAHKVEARRALILEHLAGDRKLSVDDLLNDLGTSPATLRRDIRHLQREGLIRRQHGLVAMAESFTFEPFLDDPDFRQQLRQMADEKRRIGKAAAARVQNGETLAVAPGTTTAQFIRFLNTKRDLTVITNAVNVAMELSRWKSVRVHLTGGYLSGEWFAMVGPRAHEFIATMFSDRFVFGANGIHPELGVTDHHTDEAAANAAMARQARQRVLLADHTKFGKVAKCLVCPIPQISTIITDTDATDEMIAPYLRLGIEVVRV